MSRNGALSLHDCLMAGAAVVAVAAATPAQAQTRTFNVPAQAAAKGIPEFAKQAGVQILASGNLVAGRKTNAVRGTYTVEEGLRILLQGTGLAPAKADGTGIIAIRSAEGNAGAAATAAPTGEANGAGAATQNEGSNQPIVVTGTNIRGTKAVGSQTLIFKRKDIETTGIRSAAEFLETLPQNFALVGADGTANGLSDLPNAIANLSSGSSVDLRGLGQGTTLTLLNGRRLAPSFEGTAVDISSIPVSALERIEVLTDGASAIYGSDAIGGVVNFVTRKDFNGAETAASYGLAKDYSEIRASQAFGRAWNGGNLLVTGQFSHHSDLRSEDRSFSRGSSVGDLLPSETILSGTLSGEQRLGSSLTLFADGFWSRRKTLADGIDFVQLRANAKDRQLSATTGLRYDVGSDWEIELAGSYGRSSSRVISNESFGPDFPVHIDAETKSNIYVSSLKANGTLLTLPAGHVKVAVGAEWRHENLTAGSVLTIAGNQIVIPTLKKAQNIRSLFGEAYVPLFRALAPTSFIQTLTASVAGRYDHYSSFGGHFDPKVGVRLVTGSGFALRGSYGTAYKAPALRDYNTTINAAVAEERANPDNPTEMLSILEIDGFVAQYKPQRARVFSAGIETSNDSRFHAALNYYNISFKDRIAAPPQSASVVLANAAAFTDIIIPSPTLAQVNDAIAIGNLGQGFFNNMPGPFDPSQVDAIVDLRTRNLSATQTSGLDAQAIYQFRASGGDVQAGFNANYILKLNEKVTTQSPYFSRLNRIYYPVDFRFRGSLIYTGRALTASAYANYTPSYIDDRDTQKRRIKANLTFDARVAYNFGFGLRADVSARNLFNRNPPRVLMRDSEDRGGFDPANADPLGRFVSFGLTKSW